MRVIWEFDADVNVKRMIGQIKTSFGKAATIRFRNMLQKDIKLLASMPYIGLPEPWLNRPGKEMRSIVIHHNCRLVYYLTPTALVIADVWDTRRGGWEEDI